MEQLSTITPSNHVYLIVDGMTCGSCVRTVERALTQISGVERAAVDLRSGRAHVEGTARPEELISAVETAGYQARLQGEDEEVLEITPKKGCC